MGQLILIRHGKTEYNKQKLFCGFTDVDISEEGKQDSLTVAEKIKASGLVPTKIYTSWLKRAWQTLDIVQSELNLSVPVTKHPFLNERHYGDFQGRSHESVIAEFGQEKFQTWRRSYDTRPPNGESLADVVVRAQHYFTNEIRPHLEAGETILVSAHGNTNRAMIMMLDNISPEDIVKREIAYDEPLFYNI